MSTSAYDSGVPSIESYLEGHLAQGRAYFTREEAQAAQPAKRGVVAWVADRFWWSESGLMLRRTK